MKHPKQSILSKDGISYLIPFVLITSCFALWGFANDITNPMVKAFSKIFRMSATDGALVQVAFYGGYFAMAFPAAIFIRKYSYKFPVWFSVDSIGIITLLGIITVELFFLLGRHSAVSNHTQLWVLRCCFYLSVYCRRNYSYDLFRLFRYCCLHSPPPA